MGMGTACTEHSGVCRGEGRSWLASDGVRGSTVSPMTAPAGLPACVPCDQEMLGHPFSSGQKGEDS